MHWEKLSAATIKDRVSDALTINKNYRTHRILGLPASYLDPVVFPPDAAFLKDAPFARAFMENPNHIGCHTLTGGETTFEGTHAIEKDFLNLIAIDILGATQGNYDGYVASGGTEANIQALWINRNFFMQQYHLEAKEIAVIYSSDSHYSFYKAANLLQIQAIQVEVNEHDRQMPQRNYLAALLNAQLHGVKAVIGIFNMGTTMFGSVDNIDDYLCLLKKAGLKYKVHIDAAFGGFVFPFVDKKKRLSFSNEEVDSITIDAHKMLQAPYGTGVFICRKGMMDFTHTSTASYVVGGDATLIGSRSGANIIAAWMILQTYGYSGWKSKVIKLIHRTGRLCKALDDLGIQYFRNEHINLVAIRINQISSELISKYMLVPDKHDMDARWVKIVVMDHVSDENIDAFVEDLSLGLASKCNI